MTGAQREFDRGLADVVDGMADRLEDEASERKDDFEDAFGDLERKGLVLLFQRTARITCTRTANLSCSVPQH